ncbi:MAG TPA: hypothetical protein VKQ72_08770 [Aggregatilineales bacterium]|nr:hypothetical protein [Aggregatilineales bacterium]
MQETRQVILETLHERGEATVDELVNAIGARIDHEITAVTVRHHLDILRGEELVTAPEIRHRGAPGRPLHVYALTEKALDYFPNNYQNLASALLKEIKATLLLPQINVIVENVADQMTAAAHMPDLPIEARLDHVVAYLNKHGYIATWGRCAEGFILRTCNCPYRQIVDKHEELCGLDARLITALVGIVPRRMGSIVQNEDSCTFLVPVTL